MACFRGQGRSSLWYLQKSEVLGLRPSPRVTPSSGGGSTAAAARIACSSAASASACVPRSASSRSRLDPTRACYSKRAGCRSAGETPDADRVGGDGVGSSVAANPLDHDAACCAAAAAERCSAEAASERASWSRSVESADAGLTALLDHPRGGRDGSGNRRPPPPAAAQARGLLRTRASSPAPTAVGEARSRIGMSSALSQQAATPRRSKLWDGRRGHESAWPEYPCPQPTC